MLERRRVIILFLLLMVSGYFQVRQVYRFQVREAEQWAALAVKQRLEVVKTGGEWEREIIIVVDARGKPIPGLGAKYRLSSPGPGLRPEIRQQVTKKAPALWGRDAARARREE